MINSSVYWERRCEATKMFARRDLARTVTDLISQERPSYVCLPRGLVLAYTPNATPRRFRLVASRQQKYPGQEEDVILLRTIKAALKGTDRITLDGVSMEPQVTITNRRGWHGATIYTWYEQEQVRLL